MWYATTSHNNDSESVALDEYNGVKIFMVEHIKQTFIISICVHTPSSNKWNDSSWTEHSPWPRYATTILKDDSESVTLGE